MRAVLFVVAPLLAACGTSSPSAPPPAGGDAGGARAPAAIHAAVEPCAAALRAIRAGAALDALTGCAPLFPRCAEAWRGLAGDPEAMLWACRRAYCPDLGAPVCDDFTPDDADDVAALLAGAVQLDHGVAEVDAHRLGVALAALLAPPRDVPLP